MNAEQIFVDTNILVCAHDRDAGPRHRRARACVQALWTSDHPPSLSVQVLQELFVTLERRKVAPREILATVTDYLQWNVIDNDRELFGMALQYKSRWKFSLWDAMIVAAAHRASARTLWTEDLQAGQRLDGLTIVNPLTAPIE